MTDFTGALTTALSLMARLDAALVEIIALSLRVSLSAVAVAAIIGLPLGALLAVSRFPTRRFWIDLLNTFMGLPPVVVGLMVYLILSRAGPLGPLGLLYTPAAMIIAQTLLILPIIAALTCATVQALDDEYREQLQSLGSRTIATARTLLWEGRFGLLTAVLAGFGRGNAEVGAVLIVGGNINHSTRVMTTAIALETSKGNLALALALGLILILISLIVALTAQRLHRGALRAA